MKDFIKFLFIFPLLTVGAIKPSMFRPPWKHCINQLQPEKIWKEFASPGFPHGITTQTQCSWIIVANPTIRLRMAFDTLNLTGSINNCYTQYVEFWEMNTATSVGKFCGDVRPGDYVSFGNAIRVDLKADTAGVGHIGFMLKFKLTREPGGYRQEYSFPKLPPGSEPDEDSKESSDITEDKPRKPTKPPNTGGRINLNLLKRQREKAQANKKNGGKSENSNPPSNPVVPPISNFKPKQRYPIKKNKDELIILEKEKSPLSIELWIIIVIGAGALLFVVVLCVLVWLCFCRQKKQTSQTMNNIKMKSSNDFSEMQSVRRKRWLPGYTTNFFPENQFMPPDAHLDYSYHQHVNQPYLPPNRRNNGAEKNRNLSFAHRNHSSRHATQGELADFEFQSKTLTPEKTCMYDQPIAPEPFIPLSLERAQSQKPKRKSVPTLKRKFSPWEKEEIKKGTLKM